MTSNYASLDGARCAHGSQLSRFASFASDRYDAPANASYDDLWRWSTQQIPAFWRAVWEFFAIPATAPLDGRKGVLADATMPGASWFPGVDLNYVNLVLRHTNLSGPAIIGIDEDGGRTEIPWCDLPSRIAAVSEILRAAGVRRGDVVAAYLPDVPQAIVAFLATAAIGAIWSACGADYAPQGAAARLAQLKPRALFTSVGYRYKNRWIDKRSDNAELQRLLPNAPKAIGIEQTYTELFSNPTKLQVEQVPFAHPLWVLFSSGTTGRPKGIVHGHGGIMLEHLKAVALHGDLGEGDRFFWQTALSWMMWNFRAAGLLVGSTVVCYSGNPLSPGPERLWQLVADLGVSYFGTSPAYLQASCKAGLLPGTSHDLSRMKTIGSTGSPLPPDLFQWITTQVSDTVAISSISGGTDVCTAFAGGTPGVPAMPGELPARFLGVDLHSWSPQRTERVNQVGELVVVQPMPSMPVKFWDDDSGARYRAAYFEYEWADGQAQNVWRHGDWVQITEHGSLIIHGRSDATLNRQGIRMGSADIYEIVEALDEIDDALVLGVNGPNGAYWMPLFVTLAQGIRADDRLREKIRQTIRTNLSPRYVPDEVIEAPGIPRTRTGKKLEVPITAILAGHADVSLDPQSIDIPDIIDWYRQQGQEHQW